MVRPTPRSTLFTYTTLLRSIPKLHGVDVTPYFTNEYFARQTPVWQDIDAWNSLGEPEEVDDVGSAFVVQATDKSASSEASSGNGDTSVNFFFGLILGLIAFLTFKYREGMLNLFVTSKTRESKDA